MRSTPGVTSLPPTRLLGLGLVPRIIAAMVEAVMASLMALLVISVLGSIRSFSRGASTAAWSSKTCFAAICITCS